MDDGSSRTPSKVVKEEVLWEGTWLRMVRTHYTDPVDPDRVRTWETLERTNHSLAEVDAVEIVALVKRAGHEHGLILVRQFRPPTGRYCVEVPAGLVDAKEPVNEAALRELFEETGYQGKVTHVSKEVMFGVAVSSTSSAIVTVEVNGDIPENVNPEQHLEESEFVEVFVVPLSKVPDFLRDRRQAGDAIDDALYAREESTKSTPLNPWLWSAIPLQPSPLRE